MISVRSQLENSSNAISQNIEKIADSRDLLSQNVLSQLRNLVEGAAVLFHKRSLDTEFKYDEIEPGLTFVRGNGRLNFIGRFHKLIQKIASHYTLDGDASERLMLKYYEYLFRLRAIILQYYFFHIIPNLESFPLDLDPSLREYHEKIADRIDTMRNFTRVDDKKDRYYIQRSRPFFTSGRIYYEITFCRAVNKVNKFDRIIAFTDLELSDKYAVNLTLRRDQIEVLGQIMPIMLILTWEVSIRSCELKNFSRILGQSVTGSTSSNEYRYLMKFLTRGYRNLVDLMEMNDQQYQLLKEEATSTTATPQIFPVLDEARRVVGNFQPGGNALRYLLLRMHNQTLKSQYYREGCGRLSNLKLLYGCIPFDEMPFCTSLPGHNPRFWDLADCIDMRERRHEFLARRVRINVENRGFLYSPVGEFDDFGDDIEVLINCYNDLLYKKHKEIRKLVLDKRHVFIQGYEEDTYKILQKLKEFSSAGISGHGEAVTRWLTDSARNIDDQAKSHALKQLFSQSRVALIYGAAGTGKSTMVDHIAHYFSDKRKLFLAHTHPATDNLKRKVTARNSDFRTVSSEIRSSNAFSPDYDLLVIDECSTVSNSDFLKVLEKTTAKLIVLVGDVYQIESIQFGNWFEIIRSFIPNTSVFELTTPFRTKNSFLLEFWSKVREIEDDLTEVMVRNNYSSVLDSSIFLPQGNDEIILCLNYDGLYGINNINRFLQSSNPNEAIIWEDSVYKIGDPVLFFATERFKPVIYNNLKGRIIQIERHVGYIQFDVELDRPLTELDVIGSDLEWVSGSTVRFSVYELRSSDDDDDDDSLNITVPFQVAYAVSIHKAQGLEYDSVKVVITDANEDDISHSIFYTAITRARERLKIFWTPETQQNVINSLQRISRKKDVALLSSRRGLTADRS